VINVYLHIGSEKTGTTSVQRFLKRNRNTLLDQKVLYPAVPGDQNHVKLLAYAIHDPEPIKNIILANRTPNLWDNEENRTNFVKGLHEEIYGSAIVPETVIFSNEHSSSRLKTKEEIQHIKELFEELFGEHSLKIVIYLRRQDHFLTSSYNTAVTSGLPFGFNKYFEKAGENYRMHYYSIIKNWENIFGKANMIIRLYNSENLVGGSSVHDFIYTTNISPDERLIFPRPHNTSLDIYCLEILRHFNARVPLIKNDRLNTRERGNIVEYLRSISGDDRIRCNPLQLALLKKRYEGENRRIVEEYSIEQPGSFLYDDIDEDPSMAAQDHQPIEISKLHDTFARLWIESQKDQASRADQPLDEGAKEATGE
jgi:hypothetical protein